MNKKIKRITESAFTITLVIIVQITTRTLGQQLVTGSLVNLVLALSAMIFGWKVGAVAAVVSPFVALLLGINAQVAVVPAIAAGNLIYVLVTAMLIGVLKGFVTNARVCGSVSVAAASICKFILQYMLIVKWIAPAFLPEKAAAVVSVNFGVIQLITACTGGLIASQIAPLVMKGVRTDS